MRPAPHNTTLLAGLREFWAARKPRERVFLTVLALVIMGAALIQGLWSAHQARERLREQVPRLRGQVETMQRQAAEIRQLQAQPAIRPPEGPALVAAVEAAARGAGLALSPGEIRLEGPRELRLRAELPFDAWLAWLAALQRDVRLRLIRGDIEAAQAPGTVRVDALLALPEPS